MFGATDPKAGAAGSVLDVLGVTSAARSTTAPRSKRGLLGDECGDLLRAFFASRR